QHPPTVNDQATGFPPIGGKTTGSSIPPPISLNTQPRRTVHNITVTFSRTAARSLNHYAFTNNVGAAAGIAGISTDPFDWGVPSLSFSSVSSVRDVTPSRRSDERWQTAYTWMRPFTKHTLRVGADARLDRSASETDSNAD